MGKTIHYHFSNKKILGQLSRKFTNFLAFLHCYVMTGSNDPFIFCFCFLFRIHILFEEWLRLIKQKKQRNSTTFILSSYFGWFISYAYSVSSIKNIKKHKNVTSMSSFVCFVSFTPFVAFIFCCYLFWFLRKKWFIC
jgi:hypothetical protein